MAIADKKIKQTFLNLLYVRVIKECEDAHADAVAIRGHAAIGNHFTAGQLSKFDDFITSLAAIKDDAVSTAVKNAYVKSHRNKAVEIVGVND